MSRAEPDRVWWTAEEIAAAGLPDMPGSTRGVDKVAKRYNWRAEPELARRRRGRGGGWEYHWKLLPSRAQVKLMAAAKVAAPEVDTRPDRDAAWAWFEGLPEGVKDKARHRLAVIAKVEALETHGYTRFLAVHDVARLEGLAPRTIWNWFASIDCVRRDDRLPYLAPKHRAAKRPSRARTCSPEFWDFLKADYLRPSQPSFSACYRRAARVAAREGWSTLPERTMRRRLDAEVPKTTRVLARRGVDALKGMYPAQTRDKTAMHAMEAVNADFHRFDVFVRWPVAPGSAESEIVRPQLVAFQDIHSGKVLSWRVDRTPNKAAVALALGDMIEAWGIPEHVLLDNGREFANKFLTGQAETRHRFKIKDDDIPGVLTTLGCQIHWATPYSGQSKPIERAFRDFCDSIARDPRFEGAWTGNRPDAKPENYGNRAIPLERFLEVLAEGLAEHNARPGRDTATARKRSFDATFDASYAEAPIRKATEAQRRLWLMGAEGVKADRTSGRIAMFGNTYWSDWMHELAGCRVVARFDPADLREGLHLYALSGEYLGHAACQVAAGFFDIDEARTHASAVRRFKAAERAALEAHRRMSLTEIGQYLDAAAPGEGAGAAPETKVVRPVFGKGGGPGRPAAADPAREAEREAEHQAIVSEFEAHRASREVPEETDLDRFRRALRLEAELAAGREVARDAQRALSVYQTTPEYLGLRDVYESFGDEMFAGMETGPRR